MSSRKEILEDIRVNSIVIHINDYSIHSCGNYRKATDEEIENMGYWELWRNWTQAKHTLTIVSGLKRA